MTPDEEMRRLDEELRQADRFFEGRRHDERIVIEQARIAGPRCLGRVLNRLRPDPQESDFVDALGRRWAGVGFTDWDFSLPLEAGRPWGDRRVISMGEISESFSFELIEPPSQETLQLMFGPALGGGSVEGAMSKLYNVN